jgi:polyhydroxyalkanoate synthase
MAGWAWHLAASPGKQIALVQRIWPQSLVGFSGLVPRPREDSDPRFENPDWNFWPFNLLRDTFRQTEAFWQEATTGLPGVSPHHEHLVNFAARQWTDMLAPSNCWWLNPEVLRAAAETGGRNFADGARHWANDQQEVMARYVPGASRRKPEPHCVGRDVPLHLARWSFATR